MPVKSEIIEVDKSYMGQNGAPRTVFEIVPRNRKRPKDPSDDDIIKYETSKKIVSYEGGVQKVRSKVVREKQSRRDFAKEVVRQLT